MMQATTKSSGITKSGAGSLTIEKDPFPAATPKQVVAVTDKVFPAVVRLDVAQEIYRDGKRTLQRGIGSGVIIDADGHILTNYHVAGRAAEIFVTLSNKERVRGKLVGDDHWTDLAVVRMDMDEVSKKKFAFTYAELGDSKSLVTGQDVIAIGTPFGLARTMTLGIVSNTDRTFYPDKQDIDDYETGEFSNWIQMDTPIAPGNSGGPLVDLNGKIVGINTRGVSGQALNFAIPIDEAKQVVKAILESASESHQGKVTRGYLGVDFKPLQDLETFYELDINKGALISTVDRGSPAAKAGLKAQDILLAINGTPTNVRFPEEISPARKLISQLPIGTEVELSIRRDGKEQVVKATVEKLESRVGDEKEFKAWGLSVRDVTRAYMIDNRLDDDTGVVVTSVSSGEPADKAKLQPGDVIRQVNGTDVVDLDSFASSYEQAVKDKTPQLLLGIQRGRGVQSAVLKVTY
ncbi:MAG: trypsin-like peptidase domain-containing protein [Tepidisphaeraceae bacterium]